MKVILLKDIKKVGKKYEIKDVSDGQAMNMLIPGKMALPATPGNVKMIEVKRSADMNDIAKTEAELQKVLAEIKGITVEIKGKVNDKGHLFAGIHKEEITLAVKKQKNIHLDAGLVVLEKPIKEVGEHSIVIKVGDREAAFKVIIKAE